MIFPKYTAIINYNTLRSLLSWKLEMPLKMGYKEPKNETER